MELTAEQHQQILSIAQKLFGEDGKVNIEIDCVGRFLKCYIEPNFYTCISHWRIEQYFKQVSELEYFHFKNSSIDFLIMSSGDKKFEIGFEINTPKKEEN